MLPSYLRSNQYTPNKSSSSLRASYNLWVHDERFSRQDLVLNPDCFPACRVGDLLKITQPHVIPTISSTTLNSLNVDSAGDASSKPAQQRARMSPPPTPKQSRTGILTTAGEKSRTLVLQISIAQHIAAFFELHPRKDVIVRKIDKETIAADYVELSFRDQYVGRSDMWRLRTLLTGTCVYEGKKVLSLGIRAQIKDIVVAGRRASCGYITENTKTIFRSETAKYFIFIQMSKEMWEFDEDGELYFEKCVHGFLPQLFAKWKDAGANHVVSIVLFARIHYQANENEKEEVGGSSLFEDRTAPDTDHSISILTDASGRPYRDFYKVVVDWETRSDWSQVLIPLKKEFISFQRDVLQQPSVDGSTILAGANSTASEGNVLEAINLALNPFDRHYIDRDLSRTGLGIVVITPGPGVFEAEKTLLRLTAQRMVDNGIGLDLVCLSKPPLCTVPLFQYMSKDWAGPSSGWGGVPSGASTDADTATSGERRWGPITGAGNLPLGKTAGGVAEKTGVGGLAAAGVPGTGTGNLSGASGSPAPDRLETWDPLYYDDSSTDNPEKTFYTVPHWVMCSFWSRDEESDRQGFSLRCKMYEVQMMGVMEQIGSTIIVPYLDEQEAAKDVQSHQFTAEKTKDVSVAADRTASGVVRFEIGAEDDEDSPAVSVVSDHHIDCDRYDEMVFASTTRQRAGAFKNRSNSMVNVGSSEADGSPIVKNARGAIRVDSHASMTLGGSGRGMITGTVSVSPEGAPSGAIPTGVHTGRMGFHRSATGDTVRSIDSDGQGTRGAIHVTPYYHPWEDGDTLNAEERVALLRIKARLEQARSGGMHISSHHDTHSEHSIDNQRKISMNNTDEMDDATTSASTSLAPIRIRSTNHLGVRQTYRDGLSTSGSFKSHSPLANYEYLRQQYARLSPGKPAAPVGLRPPQQPPFRANLINPCNPSRNIVRATSQVLRWQHVFPQLIVPTRNDIVIHWKSLSTPACLPLTTDFFPTHEDLSAFYQEYTYTVSPADDATPYQSRGEESSDVLSGRIKVEALLVELIGQRLSQGFQLIRSALGGAVNASDRGEGASQSVVGNMSPQLGNRQGELASKRLPGSTADGPHRQTIPTIAPPHTQQTQTSHELLAQSSVSTPFYLSLGDHVHKLSYDASGQNVEVKRYVRKVTYSTLPIHYACGIWRKNDDFYRPKPLAFAYPPVTLYNWNYLDHLISGYQEELTENLRFWRTRFLLIPLESVSHMNPFLNPQGEDLDEEEVRVVGFEKFIEVFERARWRQPWEDDDHDLSGSAHTQQGPGSRKKKKGKFGKKLQIHITTLNTSRFIRDEVLRRGLARTEGASSSSSVATSVADPHLLTRRGSATSAPHLATATSNTPISTTAGTTLSPSISSTNTALTRASSFTAIAQAMQAPPPAGIVFGDRRWHFRLYESVFIGSECVEWMVRNLADVDSREEAVDFGNVLLNEGFFEHANRKHKFLDGHYFYRIRGEYKVHNAAYNSRDKDKEKISGPLWFGNRTKSVGSTPDLSIPTSENNAVTRPSSTTEQPTSQPTTTTTASSSHHPARVEPFPLTRRMVIDLDPQRRSPRRETALLHYDTVHNPRHCYHFQLHWLVCSPRWIEDLVAGWTRVAEKCGFKMVEAGTSQADTLSDDNPFLSMTHIVPCVPPPTHTTHSAFPSHIYLTEIMRRFNFVQDVESDASLPPNSVSWSYDRGAGYKRTQYVHRSGVAFVQIATKSEGGGFWWVANRMHLTGSGSSTTSGGG
ncbi:hypothetical protein DFJ77DRAFT_425692, partial [Powellomyces hirtus]